MLENFRWRTAPAILGAAAVAAAQTVAAQALPDLDVPYVTTPDKVVDAMLALAGITARDFVLD